VHADERAEHLLRADLHVGQDAGEHRRCEHAVDDTAAGGDLRPGAGGLVDPSDDAVALALVDQRLHVGGIVEPDADLDLAAAKIVAGGYGYSGQTCISVQRVYVHDAVRDEVVDRVVAKVEQLVVGDPLDDATDVSALINESERDRIVGWIDEATGAGAKIAVGGGVIDGVLAPTVLTGVLPDMKVCSQEVFGPLIGVHGYSDVGDALALANDSRYGLQAAIFTNDLRTALRAAHELDFGGVTVNEMPTFRTDQMPYGGVKDSGNTKEGPHYAVREMTEERLVVIQS